MQWQRRLNERGIKPFTPTVIHKQLENTKRVYSYEEDISKTLSRKRR